MQNPDDSGAMNFDLPRIGASPLVRRLVYRPRIESTNTLALTLAAEPEFEMPAVVLAQRQTSGRGRGENQWWSAPGALTFSWVIDPPADQLPVHTWPRVSLTCALAVCEVVESLAPSQHCRIKWPNDVFLGEAKICGILIETPPAPRGRLVVGVGLNVNNSLADAPEEVRNRAASLIDATGQAADMTDVLLRLVARLTAELESLAAGDEGLPKRWQARNVLAGRTVIIQSGNQHVKGRCVAINRDATLQLETFEGPRRLNTGTVLSIA